MRDHETSGYLLLNKKQGLTSFEALRPVKKAFSTGKVGHTGTLDRFAAGLLLVLVNRAVKLAPWFSGSDKHYEGTVRFGLETDTLDPEGVLVAEGAIPSQERIQEALSQFRGDILQAPPAYSALHIQGERASVLARSGKAVEMQKRPVSVYALELRSYLPPEAVLYVHCSKGTYIRSLARDIAVAAGSRAHLGALTRTRIAGFHVSDAVDGEDSSGLIQALRPVDVKTLEALGLPYFIVSDEAVCKMLHGNPPEGFIAGEALRGQIKQKDFHAAGVVRRDGEMLGILEKKAGIWRYGYVYARD
ncbi:MAG: tRNA pseudouridine(55) synthase TruB [Treponema sp.]|jgi:tRNA pseudouridine55 synthase|nr:tRNA pseudouridine(55) synthase TruB [Treponema sp.]